MALAAFLSLPSLADDNDFVLRGYIKESLGKTDLMKGYAIPIDADGNPGDTLRAGVLLMGEYPIMTTRAQFYFPVERKDSTYVFEIGCEGYIPQVVVFKVEKIGKREKDRWLPETYLEREPLRLKDLTVTTSKIKFYNRGDTIVYNADAFQLAEGSMLDGLISQLPGVELNSNGQIKVNGEFVESLLLNGRQFFDSNNNLLLKNLAAYTVKNVEVYRGQSFSDKWIGKANAPTHLTMNVKLKKEYNIGLMLNAQAGYGTDDRYMGRLFAGWFNSTTQVMLLGNINNLNDTREPGKNSSWTPEQMPTGKKRYQMLGLAYDYQSTDYNDYAKGNVTYENNHFDSRTYTDRTNFFATRNTYDYTAGSDRTRDMTIRTSHSAGTKLSSLFYLSGKLKGNYKTSSRLGRTLSASFDDPQHEMSMDALEIMYGDASAEALSSVINRSSTLSDADSRKGAVDASMDLTYRIPQTSDRLNATMRVTYDTQKEKLWDDYNVTFGDMSISPLRRRNYIDNSPNHDLNLYGSLSYWLNIGAVNVSLGYLYNFHDRTRDSYAYALDRLEDMGVFGVLPAGYRSALDAGNSYTSSLIENRHSINPSVSYSTKLSNGGDLNVKAAADLGMLHSRYNYMCDGMLYPVRRTSFVAAVPAGEANIRYGIGNRMKGQNMYVVLYDYTLQTTTPDLLHMVDVIDSTDPLNIMLGNPDLKNSYAQTHHLGLKFFSGKYPLNEFLDFNYSPVSNALVRGYTYNGDTGERRIRSYNVSGTFSAGVTNTFNLQFGRQRQFTLSSITGLNHIHSVDMVGLDSDVPMRSTVNTRNLSEDLKLDWRIGKQALGLKGSITGRHTDSDREGFAPINAKHLNYGLTCQFVLPAGFGLNTDFTFYTRRGYGVRELDTTDAVWNMRATYTRPKGRWVFMLDGFDLLHRLSNVHYAVNAAGRTVTYTNTLPRYVLLSVQYRLTVNPKRR